MSAPKFNQKNFFWLVAVAAALLLIVPTIVQRFVDDPVDAAAETPVVLTGAHDPEPPVIKGGAGTWEELYSKVGDNAGYWQCFEQRTAHTKADADAALAAERTGKDLRVKLVSNASDEQAAKGLDSKGVPMDPALPIIKVNGFSNTRGAGEGNCEAFDDGRSQVRVALTLGDGTPVVLSHCGNPIGKPPTPAPEQPSQPTPGQPAKPGKPTVPPGTTPTTVPPAKPKKCAGQTGEYCGSPDSGPELDPVQSNPQPPTPGYVPGNAEKVVDQQNADAAATKAGADPYRPTTYGTPGTGTGSGVTTPSGQTSGPSGNSTGGTAGASNPDNNTNTAGQTSNGTVAPPP